MNHPFSEEDIIRYLRGDMLEAEQLPFVKEMSSNQHLTNEVDELKITLKAIDKAGEDILKERFKKLEKWNKIKKWLAITFGMIAIIITGLIMKKTLTDDKPLDNYKLYATHFEKYRAPVIERNILSQLQLISASQAYEKSDYANSSILFGSLCNENNLQPCFYAALSYLYNGQEVHEYLRVLLSQNESYATIFLWNSALFEIRKGNLAEAESLLKKLILEGSYKKEEAMTILEELRNHK